VLAVPLIRPKRALFLLRQDYGGQVERHVLQPRPITV
jgi:hypothetical protein